jgi:hypothetical protein
MVRREVFMVNYIYEGCDPDGSIETALRGSSAFNLVKELHFKYNMSVTGIDEVNYWGKNGARKAEAFLMAKPDGLNICKVYTEQDGADTIYHYYSPYYEKDRGSDSTDRKTLRSKKLSWLMGSLKKNEVVPPDVSKVYTTTRSYTQAVRAIADTIGNENRPTSFNPDQEYELLKALLNKESLSDELLTKATNVLANHEKITDVKTRRAEELKRFFGKSYAVLADGTDSVVTGIVSMAGSANDYYFEQVVPLRRCKTSDLGEHFPELAGYVAMLKAHTEGSENVARYGFASNCLPRTTHHFEDLDMITTMWDSPDHFKGVWMFTPCLTT